MAVSDRLLELETKAKIFSTYFTAISAVVASIAIPVAISFATLKASDRQAKISGQETCIDKSLSLAEKIDKAQDIEGQLISDKIKERWRTDVAQHGELLSKVCSLVGIELPSGIRQGLRDVYDTTDDPSNAAAIKLALTTSSGVIGAQTSSDQDNDQATAPNGPPPRVYFHIVDEAQREHAKILEADLNGMSVEALGKIVVPGIEKVSSTSSPTVAQLRCFRKTECEKDAPRILTAINNLLISPNVVIQPLYNNYETSKAIRDQHYELWFPGAISPKSQ